MNSSWFVLLIRGPFVFWQFWRDTWALWSELILNEISISIELKRIRLGWFGLELLIERTIIHYEEIISEELENIQIIILIYWFYHWTSN